MRRALAAEQRVSELERELELATVIAALAMEKLSDEKLLELRAEITDAGDLSGGPG